MLTDVSGVRVGHWTDAVAQTGCTVVLFPDGTVASAEIRGGAPAAHEMALLEPQRTIQRLDALVLTGGSAFGLASAAGVMRWCEERGVGVPTGAGPVPIVAGLGIFDLVVGDGSVRPGPDQGYAACEAASADGFAVGLVGAGTGATFAKWQGREHRKPGGLVTATVRHGDLVVSALVVVNAVGDVGVVPGGEPRIAPALEDALENTTIGVIATNAKLGKQQCMLVAQRAHDGLARVIDPVHTAGDGDAFVVAATGALDAGIQLEAVRSLASTAVERAVLTLTTHK